MSMLTPRGSGARSGPRIWPLVAGALLALAVVAATAYGWWWFLGRPETAPRPESAPSRVCSTPTRALPASLPRPEGITLAVANGTDQDGLAVATADQLASIGFVVGEIGNTQRPVESGSGVVRYPKEQFAKAVTIASWVPGVELAEVRGTELTLWLGPAFSGVADEADPSGVRLPLDDPVCRRQG